MKFMNVFLVLMLSVYIVSHSRRLTTTEKYMMRYVTDLNRVIGTSISEINDMYNNEPIPLESYRLVHTTDGKSKLYFNNEEIYVVWLDYIFSNSKYDDTIISYLDRDTLIVEVSNF